MAGFSDYWEAKILDHTTGKTDIGTLPTAYIGLYTAAPTDAGGGTEVSGGSYARKSTPGADWNAASGGSVANAAAITFVQATADWGTVTHFGIFDAASGGNLLMWGTVTPNKAVQNGDTARFAAGQLTLTLD